MEDSKGQKLWEEFKISEKLHCFDKTDISTETQYNKTLPLSLTHELIKEMPSASGIKYEGVNGSGWEAVVLGSILGCITGYIGDRDHGSILPSPSFPFPPPCPSSQMKLNSYLFNTGQSSNLQEIKSKLERSLLSSGYGDIGYYTYPQGFAIVTRYESITEDGFRKEGVKRYKNNPEPNYKFWTSKFWKSLMTADPGYYRVFAFIVSDQVIEYDQAAPNPDEAESWAHGGGDGVNHKIIAQNQSQMGVENNYQCLALVYEFEKFQYNNHSELKRPSRLSILEHLKKSYILDKMQSSNKYETRDNK